jgi:hypothetical protein
MGPKIQQPRIINITSLADANALERVQGNCIDYVVSLDCESFPQYRRQCQADNIDYQLDLMRQAGFIITPRNVRGQPAFTRDDVFNLINGGIGAGVTVLVRALTEQRRQQQQLVDQHDEEMREERRRAHNEKLEALARAAVSHVLPSVNKVVPPTVALETYTLSAEDFEEVAESFQIMQYDRWILRSYREKMISFNRNNVMLTVDGGPREYTVAERQSLGVLAPRTNLKILWMGVLNRPVPASIPSPIILLFRQYKLYIHGKPRALPESVAEVLKMWVRHVKSLEPSFCTCLDKMLTEGTDVETMAQVNGSMIPELRVALTAFHFSFVDVALELNCIPRSDEYAEALKHIDKNMRLLNKVRNSHLQLPGSEREGELPFNGKLTGLYLANVRTATSNAEAKELMADIGISFYGSKKSAGSSESAVKKEPTMCSWCHSKLHTNHKSCKYHPKNTKDGEPKLTQSEAQKKRKHDEEALEASVGKAKRKNKN